MLLARGGFSPVQFICVFNRYLPLLQKVPSPENIYLLALECYWNGKFQGMSFPPY